MMTLWFALSAENPATTFGGTTPVLPFGGTIVNTLGAVGAAFPQTSIVGGSLFNNGNALSLNQMPDIIGKVAWDPIIADRTIHMEAFGIFRQFNDRIIFPFGTGTVNGFFGAPIVNHNNQTVGDAVGGSILIPIIPKVLDARFSALTGRGIGRYGASQLADATFKSDGSLAPIPETMLLAGLTWHALPGLGAYTYAGEEDEPASFGFSTVGPAHAAFGYGNPAFVNAGCNIEDAGYRHPRRLPPAPATLKLVRQITERFLGRRLRGCLWRGSRAVAQCSFTQFLAFAGCQRARRSGTKASVHTTSLRYYRTPEQRLFPHPGSRRARWPERPAGHYFWYEAKDDPVPSDPLSFKADGCGKSRCRCNSTGRGSHRFPKR